MAKKCKYCGSSNTERITTGWTDIDPNAKMHTYTMCNDCWARFK